MDYEYHMPISRLFIVVNVAAGVGILTTCFCLTMHIQKMLVIFVLVLEPPVVEYMVGGMV
jgi:hypothetical protein